MTPRKLHLGYVVHTLNPGGTERLVVDMSIAFSQKYLITVFCLDEPGAWAHKLRSKGIPVICVWRQPGFDIALSLKLARCFRKFGVDVVHAHQCTPWFYSAMSRIHYRETKLLFQEHGRFFPEPDKPLRRIVNRHVVRKLTHRFVAVSKDIRDRLVRYEGLDANEIDVAYNGVQPPTPVSAEERQELRESLGFSEEDIVVGSVGRLDEIKNFPMLIDGVLAVSEKMSCVKGLLVGDGPEFISLSDRVKSQSRSDAVVLTGFRDDARQLVQCMDLFVLTSFSEGTSMALLEAIASCVPVVVTEVGGNTEIVQKGSTGWTIPSGDIEGLVAAVEDAVIDKAKARRFAAAGREEFVKKFTFSSMLSNYDKIYESWSSPGVIG